MKKFTLIQKARNKIRVKGTLNLDIDKSAKVVSCKIISKGNTTLKIGKNTTLRGVYLELLDNNSTIIIEDDCKIGEGCYLSVKEGKSITVHKKCMLSRNVKIMTSDGHPIYDEDGKRVNFAKDIVLEQKVWCSDNVTILKGVKVGENSVLGINSTVTKDVPNNSIAVGNPAKVVKSGILWDE